jgi:hypothetical protein
MIDIKVDLNEEVRSVQNLLFQNLAKKSDKKIPSANLKGILIQITKYECKVIEACLGEFGLQLVKFVEHFNLDHPAVAKLILPFNDTKLSEDMCEILEVGALAYELGLNGILALMQKTYNDLPFALEFARSINYYPPIRAVKRLDTRTKLREQAKLANSAGSVHFSEFEIKYPEEWMDVPSSMIYSVRCNDSHIDDIEERKKVIKRFLDLGMSNQARVYQDFLATASMKLDDQYCGFYKVDIDRIGMTLAKVHGFVMNINTTVFLSFAHNVDLMKFFFKTVCISPRFIKEIMHMLDEDWFVDDPSTIMDALDCTDHLSDWRNLAKAITHKCPLFHYCTRVYLCSNNIIQKLMPLDAAVIIDRLESFSDYGNMPVFDHYLVAVPTIKITEMFFNARNKGFFIHDGRHVRAFERREDASVFLDLLLLKQRMVRPFLIGQKEDEQYPIGYWV